MWYIWYIDKLYSNHNVTPSTRQSGDAVIRLNSFPTLGTTSVTISFHPVMLQLGATSLRLLRLDVRCNARGRCSLNATLVDCELAHCA